MLTYQELRLRLMLPPPPLSPGKPTTLLSCYRILSRVWMNESLSDSLKLRPRTGASTGQLEGENSNKLQTEHDLALLFKSHLSVNKSSLCMNAWESYDNLTSICWLQVEQVFTMFSANTSVGGTATERHLWSFTLQHGNHYDTFLTVLVFFTSTVLQIIII